ncbi:MAG: hypothetical protein AB1592_13275 [Pseudomonadota bacterium]
MLKMIFIPAAVLAALLVAGCGPYQLTPAEQSTAELGARDFAERSGGNFVSCSGQDSDSDGYVTCAVSIKSTPTDLVCAYKANARGCKRK